ncbi:MAG: hypothetical protein ABFD07_00505 [Methanobacterium sp.]
MIENPGSLTDGAGIGALLLAGLAAVKQYGPTVLKVLSKLLVSSSVADLAKEQGTETALAKLQTPDDLFCILESFELDKDGHVVLKEGGRVNKLLKEDRPLTTFEKDEIIRATRNIFPVKKE